MVSRRRNVLPRLALNRPVSVVMALTALFVVGFFAYLRIPLNMYPEGLENPRIHVWANYPDAGPIEVEEKVTRHLEEAVATVSGLDKTKCYSRIRQDSTSLTLVFIPGTDLSAAVAEVNDRIDRIRSELPEELEDPRVRHWDAEDRSIIWGGCHFEGSFESAYYAMDRYLRPILQRIEGVANVDIWGRERKMIHIDINQKKARTQGIELEPLVNRIRRENVSLSGGLVHEGGRKILMRSPAKYHDEEEIRRLLIDPEHDIRLEDIANVELRRPKKEWLWRVDRREQIGFDINRAAGGNILEISRRVRATLEELASDPQFKGMEFHILWDQGEQIQQSVDNLKSSALWGGLFAVIILYFFLRAFRMTLIIFAAIPLSIMATLIALYFSGWSLNVATMMGLMLSLGLVVDNAIVIVENIHRKRRSRVGARDAAIEGTGEVGLAITMATLTTVVVFLPLLLLSDDADFSFWMVRIGVPVIVGLTASLLIALLIIPLATLRLSNRGIKSEIRSIVWLRGHYERLLRLVLTRRLDAFLIALIALFSIQIPMKGIMKGDKEQGAQNEVRLNLFLPPGLSIEEKGRSVADIENAIFERREEYNLKNIRSWTNRNRSYIRVAIQTNPNDAWYSVAWGDFLEWTGLKEKSHMDYLEIVRDLKERIKLPPGHRLQIRGNGSDQNEDNRLKISLYGEDSLVLMNLVAEVERRLKSIPDLVSVDTDIESGTTELRVRLNRDSAKKYGINPQVVSQTIGYALRGVTVGKITSQGDREVDIQVMLEESDKQSISNLLNVGIRNEEGQEIPLESVASVTVEQNQPLFRRQNRQTNLNVTAIAAKDDSERIFAQIDKVMEGFHMPHGYRWDKGERFVRLKKADQSRRFAIVMAITFVFLLMGALFESLILPFSVIVAIPFAFVGVYWTLYLTDTTFEQMASLGMVILIGVVVNNAIVLVDLVNRLRQEGSSRMDALIKAGRHRFRPILMTTFTTAAGLIPMAVGNSQVIGQPYAPLGRTMMGGLIASTALSLVIVPLFYTFFDDLREWSRGFFKRVLTRPTVPLGSPVVPPDHQC